MNTKTIKKDKQLSKIEKKLQKFAVNVSIKIIEEAADDDCNTDLSLVISGTGLALDYIFHALSNDNEAQVKKYWDMVKEAIEIVKD